MNIAQTNRNRLTEKISLKLRFLRTNPACFVEGMKNDISLSMLLKIRTVFVWTGEVFEAVFVVQPCVMQPMGLKIKDSTYFSEADSSSNNT